MPQLTRGDVSLRYEEFGDPDGFPLFMLSPGALDAKIEAWERQAVNPLKTLNDEYRLIGMDCRNAGLSYGPFDLEDPWGTYVRDALGCGPGDFPVTERVAARTVALPFHTALDADTQRRVVDELARQIAAHGPRDALTSADHA